MTRSRSHLILSLSPAYTDPTEAHRAHYASVLLAELVRRFKASGEVDFALADRIETVLWPTQPHHERNGK